MTTDTPDVLALREAARLVSQWADAVDPMPDELRAELRDLRALIPAVRAETLAGSGVSVDVTVHPEARCDRHPLGCRPSDRAAAPPTPALTAVRLVDDAKGLVVSWSAKASALRLLRSERHIGEAIGLANAAFDLDHALAALATPPASEVER